MHNAQQEINWPEILDEVISKPGLNIVDVLLERSIDIKAKDSQGETILLEASERRMIDIGIINAIIAAGADVNATTQHETTALHRAAANGRLDIVKALIAKDADVNALGRTQDTVLHRAAEGGHVEVVKFLSLQKGVKEKINAVDQYGRTALHLAASYGCAEVVLALLEAGANVNAITTSGMKDTPLHQAAAFASVNRSGAREKAQETIKILLMYGADISSTDRRGETPAVAAMDDDIGQFIENTAKMVEDEIKKMQSEKIGDTNISYDQFKQAANNRLTRYVRNINVRTPLENGEHKAKYPIHAFGIDNQLEIGKERAKLEDAATIVMKRFIGKDKEKDGKPTKEVILHEESGRKVATYLKDADLKKVLNSELFPKQ